MEIQFLDIAEETKLLVIAINHLHMKPGYWKERLKKSSE
jgi:hypothetical protein